MSKSRNRSQQSRKLMSDAEALRMVMEMMAIPGRSGEEAAVMDYIRTKLIDAGIARKDLVDDGANHRSPLGGQVGNLVLKLPGMIKGPRRLLTAHTDTVPICVGARPKRTGKVVRSANQKTGLGADDRSGTALLLSTVLSILRGDLPHPPVTFVWIVQEEVALLGARHLKVSALGKPQLAFNFDGGDPALLRIGATGGYRMTIDVHGIASHAGARPEEGVSAIAIASLAVADLVNGGWHGLVTKDGKAGTSNVGVIQGGDATNVVTNHVRIRAEARSHDAKFRGRIVKEMRDAFERAAEKVRSASGECGRVQFEGHLDYESFLLKHEEPCVVSAVAAAKSEGLDPELTITNGGLDANWLTAHGIPTVTIGCGQHFIHTVREELEIAEFHAARRMAIRLATATESG